MRGTICSHEAKHQDKSVLQSTATIGVSGHFGGCQDKPRIGADLEAWSRSNRACIGPEPRRLIPAHRMGSPSPLRSGTSLSRTPRKKLQVYISKNGPSFPVNRAPGAQSRRNGVPMGQATSTVLHGPVQWDKPHHPDLGLLMVFIVYRLPGDTEPNPWPNQSESNGASLRELALASAVPACLDPVCPRNVVGHLAEKKQILKMCSILFIP